MVKQPVALEYEYRDWAGEIQAIRVLGTIILQSPENSIYLTRLSRVTFRVHYGLQHFFCGSLEQALEQFANCFLHATECAGQLN